MEKKVKIEAVLKGYVHRGIAEVSIEDGCLVLRLTDGTAANLGKVIPEASDVFDESSNEIPSMKAVADYVGEELSAVAFLDSEVIL